MKCINIFIQFLHCFLVGVLRSKRRHGDNQRFRQHPLDCWRRGAEHPHLLLLRDKRRHCWRHLHSVYQHGHRGLLRNRKSHSRVNHTPQLFGVFVRKKHQYLTYMPRLSTLRVIIRVITFSNPSAL